MSTKIVLSSKSSVSPIHITFLLFKYFSPISLTYFHNYLCYAFLNSNSSFLMNKNNFLVFCSKSCPATNIARVCIAPLTPLSYHCYQYVSPYLFLIFPSFLFAAAAYYIQLPFISKIALRLGA